MDLQLLAMIAKLFSKRKEPAHIVTAGVDVQPDTVAVAVRNFPGMDSLHACVADIESARAKLRAAVQCKRPPDGWFCTRPAGHTGPCAAIAAPHPWPSASPTISQAEADVLTEVRRQIDQEHFSAEHDDDYDDGVLASAGAAYALAAADELYPFSQSHGYYKETPPDMWPWDQAWWKSTTPRRDLVKAAALIIAEIKKVDRAALNGAAKGDAS